MPLIKSASRDAVGENIKREVSAGRPRRQAIAIALDVQRRAGGKADGGPVSPYSIADTVRDAEQAALDQKRSMSRGDVLRTLGALDDEGRRRAALKGGYGRAAGGVAPSPPFYARAAARNLERSGMIHSPVAGRTDRVPLGVKPNSYIVPADVVSGIGQGNSMAGANALNQLFKVGPYGAAMPRPAGGGGMKMPTAGMMKGRRGFADGGAIDRKPPDADVSPFALPDISLGMDSGGYGKPEMRGGLRAPLGENDVGISGSYKPDSANPQWSIMGRFSRRFADGGAAMGMDDPTAAPVGIMAAGGEYHVAPEVVAQIGSGDMDRGHSILDAMVSHIRKKTIKTLRKLPKPKKS